ncbi:hypothetical protein CR513_57062, partial [Mucuna pruriens]
MQWKKIDRLFLKFSNEPRNLRASLATNRMNLYGNLSSRHSSCPVLLVIYKLYPWLCMKHKYVMLSTITYGPRQLGNDIDLYLNPLDEGVDVFDRYNNQNFKKHTMLFCTINDFLAYRNLTGYNVKGHKACPICEEGASYHQTTHGRKACYLEHCKFLQANHTYRQLKKENDVALRALTSDEYINVFFGKAQKEGIEKNYGKKGQPFFIYHIGASLIMIGTLLNIHGKTNNGVNTRLDLVDMGIGHHKCERKEIENKFLRVFEGHQSTL